MKSKKSKNQQPFHKDFHFTDKECSALSDALLFLLSLENFSFDTEKISEESASEAQDKLVYKETVLTRGEIRASAKAVELVLSLMPEKRNDYLYMEEDFPDLLSELEQSLPVLHQIDSVLREAVQELRKQ